VLDASEPLTGADENYFAEFAAKKRILVRNKIDLPVKSSTDDLKRRVGVQASACSPDKLKLELQRETRIPIMDVSCASGQGIEALKDAIKELVWSGEIKAEMLQVMINSRHQDALNRARAATLRTLEALRADTTLELVAMDLHIAVNAVGEIVGKTATEDLLDSIFSQFCIGK
jgi:tRNA modification GTPase